MALINATLNLRLDRQNGTFSILANSTRIYAQDANVSLNVVGWTVEEVTKTEGKTPYEPYFRIVGIDGTVLAECKLNPDAVPFPEQDGTYVMRGSLSTNTDKMVGAMDAGGYIPGMVCEMSALIYSTTEANPISSGMVYIWSFDKGTGGAPSNLPSAGEVISDINIRINQLDANKMTTPAGGMPGQVLTKTTNGTEWASSGSKPLDGKTFQLPSNDKERNQLLAYLVRELGGNIAESGLVPGPAPSSIVMRSSDGFLKSLHIVPLGNEYTTEVQ